MLNECATQVHAQLRAAGMTCAAAESLTGGQLAAALTDAPGSSETFLGGVVSYATALKRDLLAVPAVLMERHGVVSPECATAMARGVRRLTGATYGVSTTGVAGPARQEGKPPGTVYVGIAGPRGEEVVVLSLDGDRATVQRQTVAEALAALSKALRAEETGLG